MPFVFKIGNQGSNLQEFIKKNKTQLQGTRLFYIIKPKSENVYKIGIGRLSRLESYQLIYGTAQPNNDCIGVRIFYLVTTDYNSDVEWKNSFIGKLEKYVKDILKDQGLVDRGRERTTASLSQLKKIVGSFRGEDYVTEKRVSIRESKGKTTRFDKYVT